MITWYERNDWEHNPLSFMEQIGFILPHSHFDIQLYLFLCKQRKYIENKIKYRFHFHSYLPIFYSFSSDYYCYYLICLFITILLPATVNWKIWKWEMWHKFSAQFSTQHAIRTKNLRRICPLFQIYFHFNDVFPVYIIFFFFLLLLFAESHLLVLLIKFTFVSSLSSLNNNKNNNSQRLFYYLKFSWLFVEILWTALKAIFHIQTARTVHCNVRIPVFDTIFGAKKEWGWENDYWKPPVFVFINYNYTHWVIDATTNTRNKTKIALRV